MWDLWYGLPVAAQDLLVVLVLLSPALLISPILLWGHAPWSLAFAFARRYWGVSVVFVALIAISVALGSSLLAGERAIRAATAKAADPFDIVVAAPGSELTVLFASVFLQPSDMGLVAGDIVQALSSDPRVTFAAPIGFGDSVGTAPVVGTTAELVQHMAAGADIEGRTWTSPFEAVVGAAVDARIGDHLEPAHGTGGSADDEAHGEAHFEVVGRLPPLGSPWDRAVIVPIEALWQLHGLADGHATSGPLGPPFVPELFPGVPAVVVDANDLGSAYSIRADYERSDATMAFFPGAVLAHLYSIMGDVRGAMTAMAAVTQLLVATAALSGLAIVSRLFRRQLALLSALGASSRFLAAVMWIYSVGHVLLGAVAGTILGLMATQLLSQIVSSKTGLEIGVHLAVAELHAVCGFVGLAAMAALVPALLAPSSQGPAHLR